MAMKTSRDGLRFIARREALVLTAYQDGHHASVGFGTNDPALKVGDTITVKHAFDLLKKGVAKRDAEIAKLLKVELEPHQYDAISSLYYNHGRRYAPCIINLCNYKEFGTASLLFPLFDRSLAGVQMAGLKKRRLLEQAMFVHGDYGELEPIPYWPGKPTGPPQQYRLQPGDLE